MTTDMNNQQHSPAQSGYPGPYPNLTKAIRGTDYVEEKESHLILLGILEDTGSIAHRSWHKIWRRPFITVGIIALLLVIIAFSLAVHASGWDWTGFTTVISRTWTAKTPSGTTIIEEQQPTKTLWDWLNLLGILAIPVVVGFATVRFTSKQHKTDLQIAEDQQREVALQTYLDRMSELLLKENLRNSKPDDEVRNVARIMTITLIHRLNARRNAHVLNFLHESGLLKKDITTSIINLSEVDLRGIKLSRANLRETYLRGTDFDYADLSSTSFFGADLHGARLSEADLRGANLMGANLCEAYLFGANLDEAYLSGANCTKANLCVTELREADLCGANLCEAHLNGVHLHKADLRRANLSRACLTLSHSSTANFSEADLRETDLTYADLRRVNLSGANLQDADLTGADLTGANLQDADLTGADLTGANLSRAQLHGAKIVSTQWDKVKLLKGAIMPDGSKHS